MTSVSDKRIVLGVEYDGGPWQGWQTQRHGQTVQDVLEAALQRFALVPLPVVCAGRTDSGVHALEQVVHFDTPVMRDVASWVRGVNAFLPATVAVRWAREVPRQGNVAKVTDLPAPYAREDGFHARFSATARTYHYVLHNHAVQSPLLRGRAGWVFRPLSLAPMLDAARHLVGTHDFSAFRSIECQAKSPVRSMHRLDIVQSGQMFIFTLHANAFLHHMVRNIVGSLIAVGQGKRPPAWLADVLAGRDRSKAAPTFMPDGLYLARVDYPAEWQLPQAALQHGWPWA